MDDREGLIPNAGYDYFFRQIIQYYSVLSIVTIWYLLLHMLHTDGLTSEVAVKSYCKIA